MISKFISKVPEKQGQNLPLASLFKINIPYGFWSGEDPVSAPTIPDEDFFSLICRIQVPQSASGADPGCWILIFLSRILDPGVRVKKASDLGAATSEFTKI